jgi:hypothetical protein
MNAKGLKQQALAFRTVSAAQVLLRNPRRATDVPPNDRSHNRQSRRGPRREVPMHTTLLGIPATIADSRAMPSDQPVLAHPAGDLVAAGLHLAAA